MQTSETMEKQTPILEVDHLTVVYETAKGDVIAVRDVSFSLYPNEIMGLIGESGSGKSTMAYAILRMLKGAARVVHGTVRILGKDIYQLSPEELRKFRWSHFSMVFQSAMNALNPVMTVEAQVIDTLKSHRPHLTRLEAKERALELCELVRIDPRYLKSYPHELSGGMRQRIVIAIAIALEPSLVIMDEPTTALDVVVQRSIMDQIRDIQMRVHFSILFISHDFSLVSELATRIAIMYAGQIVEFTDSHSLEDRMSLHHPYTEGLWNAIPKLANRNIVIEGIPGGPPNLLKLPEGCSFHPRCRYKSEICSAQTPELKTYGTYEIACHHVLDKEGHHD